MEKLKKEGITIQSESIEIFRQEYEKMINKHQNILYQDITTIVYSHLMGIPENKIQTIIDNYLLTELKYKGQDEIEVLDERLKKSYKEACNEIKNNNKSQLFQAYIDKIKVPLRKNNPDWIEDILEDFNKELIKEIDKYFYSFKGISDTNLNKTLDNINSEIKQYIKKYQSNFKEEYHSILSNFVKNNVRKICHLIDRTDLNKIVASKMKQYIPIIKLTGYELFGKDNHFYIKNKITGEQKEVLFDDLYLTTQDKSIQFYIDELNNKLASEDKKTQIITLMQNNLKALALPNGNNQSKRLITYTKNNNNYIFYYNDKKITNIDEIKALVTIIEKFAPGMYEELLLDLDFAPILVQIKGQTTNNKNPENGLPTTTKK